MADVLSDSTASGLAQYVQGLFRKWKSNRENKLDPKWLGNLGAYNRDPLLSKKWKKAEGSEPWTSGAMSDASKQKVVAGHAIVCDVYFKGGRLPVMVQDDTLPDEVELSLADPQIPDIPEKPERDAAIAGHEQIIHRQHSAFDAKGELDKGIKLCAVYGETYFERYIYKKTEKRFVELAPGVIDVESSDSFVPAFRSLGVWPVYRDLDVDDPHEGHGVMVVDRCSPKDLMDVADDPYYIKKAIKDVITSCNDKIPDNDAAEPKRRDLSSFTKGIRRIRYYGLVPRKLAAELSKKFAEDDVDEVLYDVDGDNETDTVECHLVVAKNEVIRFVLTEREDRSIDRLVWEDPVDDIGGVGICDNLNDIQNTLNGLHRNLDDNAKIVSGLVLAIRANLLSEAEPGDFSKRVKIFNLDQEAKSAQDAFQQVKIDGMLEELKTMIQFFMDLSDHSSFIPRIQQGQQLENSQTAFELSERIERSGKYLGGVIMHIDTFVEKYTSWQYQYNMMDDSVPASKKGVWRVKALGFTSFSNRVVRLQKLLQLLGIILQNEQIMSLAKVRYLLEEICKAMDLDPAEVLKSPQELIDEADQQQLQLNQAQEAGSVDPVMAQKIQAEIDDKRAAASLKNAQADKMRRETIMKEAETVTRIRKETATAASAA